MKTCDVVGDQAIHTNKPTCPSDFTGLADG